MLKIWKQAWRRGENRNKRADEGPSSDRVSNTPRSSQLAGTIRSASQDIADIDGQRPPKRTRHRKYTDESLANHSPEVLDTEMSDVITIGEPARFPDIRSQSLLSNEGDTFKHTNTIMIVDNEHQKLTSLCKILTWTCSNGRESNRFPRKGIVLIVVDDLETGTSYAAEILERLKLPIGIYTPILHSSSVNQWVEMAKKDVVISPTNLLLESLVKGSLTMSQIQILVLLDIFALRNDVSHPLNNVMRNFYHITDELSRPKVLGLLSVPQGVEVVFDQSMLEVEDTLDAKICNITDEQREEAASLSEKPTELVVFYEPQVRIHETPLMKNLRRLDKRGVVFRTQIRNARHALSELGACACDLVWRRSLKELESEIESSMPVFEEEDELQEGSSAAITKIKKNVLDLIKNWFFAMPNLDRSSRGFNVTSKFARLIEILKACEPHGDAFRGIIFVQKRSIAYVISDLIRTLDDHVGFLRPQALSGHGASADSSIQIMDSFRSGVYNLLVVTKYAEDLDIFPATTVIRFDIFDSEVSYAHCRARAKGRECHLIHMAERGSDVHRRLLSQTSEIEPEMERWAQRVASITSAIPPRPLKETVDPYRSDSEDEDDDPTKFMKDPTTSGRIYLQDATTVIYRFVSQIENEEAANNLEPKRKMEPLFEYETFNDGSPSTTYICSVLLPRGSPIRRVSGPPCNSMAQARRTACHQTCKELFQRGLLDYRLFPRPSVFTERPQRVTYISSMMEEELSDREEDEASLPMKGHSKTVGTRSYPRKKPDFWSNTTSIMRGCLYPTIIIPVLTNKESGHEYAPILLLTRLPLPLIPSFKVFVPETTGTVHLVRGTAFQVDEDQLRALAKYTLRLLRMVTNKAFVCPYEKMAYFFAPLSKNQVLDFEGYGSDNGRSRWSFSDVGNYISWDQVKLAGERSIVALNTQDLHTLIEDTRDAIIQDRWAEFTRRYYCVRMRPDLTPLSKPEDSIREKDFKNLLEYCMVRRTSEGLQNDKQPIIEVEVCNTVMNHLTSTNKLGDDVKRPTAKYLIPELCAKCTVPASIYRTAFLIPSVMRRLDDFLLVKELNARFFDHSVREDLLHQAITASSAGMEFNYERLELLGDAYLKYLSSIYLFVTFPTQHEGALHVSRQRIISNRSLLRNANRCDLPQFIQSKPLLIKAWAPPNFIVPNLTNSINGKDSTNAPILENDKVPDMPAEFSSAEGLGSESATMRVDRALKEALPDSLSGGTAGVANQASGSGKIRRVRAPKRKRQRIEDEEQSLGDKTVADVAEAIIGAAYISGGREVALKVTKALNVPVPHVDRWSDFGRKALAPPPEITAKLKDGSIEAVEAIIGHKFKRPHLLAQALTHASIHGNAMTTYERLEFIGDAILDFLVIRHIYDRYGQQSPGSLTLFKGGMVSNSALAAVCVWAGLHEHLLFESANLAENIRHYAKLLKSHQKVEYSLAAQEGRTPGQYWVDVEPPKALSDVVESIMGAVYVSDGFSSVGAEVFFNKIIKPFFDQHITLDSLSHHPTKILLELLQSRGCANFVIERAEIPPDADGHTAESVVLVHDVILARVTDKSSINTAARRASSLAIDAIHGDPEFMLRTCDCLAKNRARKTAKKQEKMAARNLDELEEQVVENALE